MGSAVASNILRANYQIFVFDIRKEAADKLVKKGGWKALKVAALSSLGLSWLPFI